MMGKSWLLAHSIMCLGSTPRKRLVLIAKADAPFSIKLSIHFFCSESVLLIKKAVEHTSSPPLNQLAASGTSAMVIV